MRRLFLLYFFVLSLKVAFAQLVLTEIMFNPAGSEYHDEFVELFNFSPYQAINLVGWQLSDSSGVDAIVAGDEAVWLHPGQYAVVLDGSYPENSSTYDGCIPDSALQLYLDGSSFGSAGFSNSKAEPVLLIDPAGDTVQVYRYSLGNADGFSDEKINPFGPNDAGNWADSRIKGGTPGYRNSVTPFEYDLGFSEQTLTYHPALFITSGQTIFFDISVQNYGTQIYTDSVQLQFFIDTNHDAVYQQSEVLLLDSNIFVDLGPDEKIISATSWQPQTAGIYQLVLFLAGKRDQNRANDVFISKLQVFEGRETIAINEINFLTAEGETEWLELLNTGDEPILLQGWQIADLRDTCRIDSMVRLYPGQFKVFGEPPDAGQVRPAPEDSLFIGLAGFPTLNNSEDTIFLLNPGGGWVEQVPYTDDWLQGEAWRMPSLERINSQLDCRQRNSWGPSTALTGSTPGRQNSIYSALHQSSHKGVHCQPNPFSPDGDGNEDHTLIQLQSASQASRLRVRIYNIAGQRVRNLEQNTFSGKDHILAWDGRDDGGMRLPIGIYIVLAEWLDQQRGTYTTAKTTVVLALPM